MLHGFSKFRHFSKCIFSLTTKTTLPNDRTTQPVQEPQFKQPTKQAR